EFAAKYDAWTRIPKLGPRCREEFQTVGRHEPTVPWRILQRFQPYQPAGALGELLLQHSIRSANYPCRKSQGHSVSLTTHILMLKLTGRRQGSDASDRDASVAL